MAKEGIGAIKVLTPQVIPGLTDVVAIAVGYEITCAKKTNDDVVCFGRMWHGDRGTAGQIPMPDLHGVASLELGEGTFCGVFANGSAKCWGASATGPMLRGSNTEKTPVTATALVAVRSLALGANRACDVVTPGDVLCWGGADGNPALATPHKITLSSPMASVVIGANHACALGTDGSVSCWGDSFYGQAGAPKVAGAVAPTSAFLTLVNPVSLP
jgi:alpha-tubulin suppressor-like RCC1 family protein